LRANREFRTETRRLRHAFGRLTRQPLHRSTNSENPAIGRNIEHCRSMLARGIDDRPNRHLIEMLLRYMETSVVEAGTSTSQDQHDRTPTALKADEQRLKIVARALLRGEGLRTASYLRELAEIANGAGDRTSADAWKELAEAAERIIQIFSRGGIA
jgi:hypothetical protein